MRSKCSYWVRFILLQSALALGARSAHMSAEFTRIDQIFSSRSLAEQSPNGLSLRLLRAGSRIKNTVAVNPMVSSARKSGGKRSQRSFPIGSQDRDPAAEKAALDPNAKRIRVLTWNICWGCMEGDQADATGMRNDIGENCVKDIGVTGPTAPNGLGNKITVCTQNMGNAMNSFFKSIGGYDFIALQEASNIGYLNFSADMKLVEYGVPLPAVIDKGPKTGETKRAWLGVYYNMNYLGKHDGQVFGALESDETRPFLALVFDAKKLIFINLHNCQPGRLAVLKVAKPRKSWDGFPEEIAAKLDVKFRSKPERKRYRVILTGDFNDLSGQLPGNIVLPWNKARLQLKTPLLPSCCPTRLAEKDPARISPGDYIFDSATIATNRLPKGYQINLPQSDHRPVEALLGSVEDSARKAPPSNKLGGTGLSVHEPVAKAKASAPKAATASVKKPPAPPSDNSLKLGPLARKSYIVNPMRDPSKSTHKRGFHRSRRPVHPRAGPPPRGSGARGRLAAWVNRRGSSAHPGPRRASATVTARGRSPRPAAAGSAAKASKPRPAKASTPVNKADSHVGTTSSSMASLPSGVRGIATNTEVSVKKAIAEAEENGIIPSR